MTQATQGIQLLNGEQFAAQVEQGSGVTVVDFYADWCGPCKMVAPVLENLAEEFEEDIKVVKLNADSEPEVLAKYGVRGLPTIMVFKDGQPADVTVGAQPYPALKGLVEKHI